MERIDDGKLDRDFEDTTADALDNESHATTGGAAAAGAVTGGVIGLTGGPIGAALGAVGGAIVGAAAERMMHNEDDTTHPHAEADAEHRADPEVSVEDHPPMSTMPVTEPRRQKEEDTPERRPH
jgi:hypothetical protein